MGDERNKNKPSTLSSLVLLGLGALAGYAITSWYEEEKQKEQPQVNTKPKTIDYHNKCVICLENFKDSDRVTVLNCAHQFHCSCFKKLTRNQCPVCRSSYQNCCTFEQLDQFKKTTYFLQFIALNSCKNFTNYLSFILFVL